MKYLMMYKDGCLANTHVSTILYLIQRCIGALYWLAGYMFTNILMMHSCQWRSFETW